MQIEASSPNRKRRRGRSFAGLFVAVLASLALAAPAPAAAPDFLWQTPPNSIAPGPGAGQFDNPRGIVADPDTGHLYVADLNNARISEFTAWGVFVKAWGWDVAPDGAPGDTPSDQFEICTTACKVGTQGEGPGQFYEPRGLALDANGDLYVQEAPLDDSSKRVQKFSPAGQFLLMWGGEVNQGPTNPGDICTAQHLTEGDTCGAGAPGTEDGWFSTGAVGNYIAYNQQTDSIFVGDSDRIQEFETDGSFMDKIDFEGGLGGFDGKSVESLAADPLGGGLYVALEGTSDVHRLGSTSGEVLDTLEVNAPRTLAIDIDGNVYVTEFLADDGGGMEVLGFDSSGDPIQGMGAGEDFAEPPAFTPDIFQGLATNVAGPGSEEPGNLYVGHGGGFGGGSYIDAYGPPPLPFEDPPLVAPGIADQYAAAADSDGALVKALINPQYWTDTAYRVQFATEACVEAGGWDAPCAQVTPVPGSPLTAKATNATLTTPGVLLGNLQPDTVYRYRFLARSSGSGQEDVVGVGGTLVADGTDAAFTTFPAADPPNADCSNQSFRIGPGAKLPDCRAYEMVSPLDKNNGDISTKVGQALHQASVSGAGFTYSSSTPFEAQGAPNVSQYLAWRDPGDGWLSESISPPRTREVTTSLLKFVGEYKYFSPDLCLGWLRLLFETPLVEGAVPNYSNIYRRSGCGVDRGGVEALTTVAPPAAKPGNYSGLEVQGASSDGSRTLIAAEDSLTADAPPQAAGCAAGGVCVYQLYLHAEGEPLRFLCKLPNGNPINPALQACYAGTAMGSLGDGQRGSYQNALSADSRRAYFTAGAKTSGNSAGLGGGRIYLRLIEEEETLPVSQTVAAANAFFWGAARDGSAAIFEIEDGASPLDNDLYRYDRAAEDSELIAEDTLGVLGMSADATRVYFASSEAIAGSGQNSEGDEAQAGDPNLYLWERGAPAPHRFIGTLADADTGGVGPVTSRPVYRLARISPDGLHAAFVSTASLTGYDNTDAVQRTPAAEVFLYDAQEGELACVSCNRSGIRPTGRLLRDNEDILVEPHVQVAAQIPGWERSLYASRLLSEDGSRLFFESYEALVTRDTNGVQDVYQWEEAGKGDCDEVDSTFNAEAGGCVELISSGESPQASYFRDASPSGDDVFFSTLSSLVPSDYGLIDLYDARVGGGFAEQRTAPGCEGETCQGAPPVPSDPTPASASFQGTGNLDEKAAKPRRCPKGKRQVKRRGKVRCVPRKAKKKASKGKRPNKNRRAAR